MTMNPWEACALQYNYSDGGQSSQASSASDPIIYPGLYAPSGFDIMSIIVSITILCPLAEVTRLTPTD